MVSIKKRTVAAGSPVKMILMMQLICLLSVLIFAGVCAFIIENGAIPESGSGACGSVALAISTFLGALSIRGDDKVQKSFMRLLGGVIYYGILLCIAALFFSTGFTGMGRNALMVLLGCSGAILCGFARFQGKGKQKYKYRSR